MRTSFALAASILAGAPLFGAPLAQSQLYSKPTYAQVMRLIAAVRGSTSERGPWNDGSVPASYLYSTPTYAQVNELIGAVREAGAETDAKIADSISEANPAFSNAVLAVGLGFATNDVAAASYVSVTNALAGLGFDPSALDDLPGSGVYGSLGALLAALAAAVAWLKKNKVQTLKLEDGSIAKTAENGVAKLDDFFTNSNSLLTETIDDRLPIPISEKSAGFTTESYKRFIVTMSGDMTVTLHTPTSGDAEIFECRFNGTSLAADASITLAGATATTMDTDCGTVTAGKVALMSAFWNGATWDVNWKVEG